MHSLELCQADIKGVAWTSKKELSSAFKWYEKVLSIHIIKSGPHNIQVKGKGMEYGTV
jgi:hypothetical protein